MAKALVIDANAQDLLLCERALAEQDFEVKGCGDGNEGMALVRSWSPDVIVLAVELQGTSGYSVCNKLKKDPSLARITLILTSSQATEDTFAQHRRLRTHADGYVRKPLTKQALWSALEAVLEGPDAAAVDVASYAGAEEPTHVGADDALLEGIDEPSVQSEDPNHDGGHPSPVASAGAPVGAGAAAVPPSSPAPAAAPTAGAPTSAAPTAAASPAAPAATPMYDAAGDNDPAEPKTVVRRTLPHEVAATLPSRRAPAGAAEPVDAAAQLDALRQQLAELQAQRTAAMQQTEVLAQQLHKAEHQLEAAREQLRDYRARHQAAQQALAQAQQVLRADPLASPTSGADI